ncbi:MAG: threonine/serine exporter family protein [Candidatus Amulumruptor caecigallinarius]|nr:threonine/serine exporter family protein [Candidatus Amulumruptor caecigallinarius]
MIRKNATEFDCNSPGVKNVCIFLADYSAFLFASGATCIRVNKNVERIANAYCMKAEMTIMPRHIHMAVKDECNGEIVTSITRVCDTGINFRINTELSRLSWAIADSKICFDNAIMRMYEVVKVQQQNKFLLLMLVTLANASFCRLFGGDAIAMAIVALATFAGFHVKQLMTSRKIDTRIIFIVCSFVSSVLGATGMLFSMGNTPDIAIATSVLYLVPGIPFLNSFSDLLYKNYLCAFSRFADAVVLTCCLSLGLCLGLSLMKVGIF